MTARLTIQDMQAEAKSRGGKCLSKRYVNQKTKLKWECGRGHQWMATAGSVRNTGNWCPECSGNKRGSIDEMRALAISRGGKCLSKRYVTGSQKLKWECSEGHQWEARPGDVKNAGSWCPHCSGRARGTIEAMRQLANSRGGKCLSKRYVNSNSKLKWECGEGHRWEARPGDIKNAGSWCPECSGKKKGTLEHMRSIAKKHGGKCLSKRYVNRNTKLEWECAEGHKWEARPAGIVNGQWCAACAGVKRLTIQEMRRAANERGGKCLSNKYVNVTTKLKWECAQGHTFQMRPAGVRNGQWCPRCSDGISERVCRAHFQQVFGERFPKSRPKWLRNSDGNLMELDGYCKSLRLAFEHQGLQHYKHVKAWMSKADFKKRLKDDEQKVSLCSKNGVRLVLVPEIFTLTKLEDLLQGIYDECKRLRVRTPAGMREKTIDLSRAWKSSRAESNFQIVKEIASGKGGTCLSEKYLHGQHKLEFKCQKNHVWKMASAAIIAGQWCPECSGNRPLTIDSMHDLAQVNGGRCLSRTYKNNHTKLKWECSEGHRFSTTPKDVKNGVWCPRCSGVARGDIDSMKRLARRRGGKCLSKRYVNQKTKLKWECGRGHQWMATPSNVKNRGSWCPACARRGESS